MKTKNIFLLFFLIQLNSNIIGQITFQKSYGLNSIQSYAYSIKQTADSGYICMGGTLNPTGQTNMDISLIKTNQFGDTIWTKLIGTTGTEYGNIIQITNDNGFIVDGWSRQLGGNQEIYLIKMNNNGDTLWTRLFSTPLADSWPYGIVQTNDSGFVILGVQSLGGCDYNSYLFKIDQNGNFIWIKTYNYIVGTSLVKTKDNGFLFVGNAAGFSTNAYKGLFIVKTDFNGDTVWTKHYNKINTSIIKPYSVQQLSDDGYIVTGGIQDSTTQYYDQYLLKMNSIGQIDWIKQYDFGNFEISESVKQTTDGGFIFSGYIGDLSSSIRNSMIVKTNSTGIVLWSYKYGTTDNEYFHDILLTFENGYISCGETSNDGFVVKMDSAGNSGCFQNAIIPQIVIPTLFNLENTSIGSTTLIQKNTQTFENVTYFYTNTFCTNNSIQELSVFDNVEIYPNPFSCFATIEFQNIENKSNYFKMYNSKGQLVKQINNITNGQIKIDRVGLDNGIYFFQLLNDNKIIKSGKLLIE